MFLMFDTKNWINNILRPLFGGIDSLVYSLISWIIEGIFNISNLLVSDVLVQQIYNRIYLVLSIYMIFKLSFSFLKYLTNPDAMTDKEQGVGKIVGRTIIMIVLIIALPILFFEKIDLPNGTSQTLLNATQQGVLATIPKIILGSDNQVSSTTAKENGDIMAVMMLRNFYFPAVCNPDSSLYNQDECYDADGMMKTSSFSTFQGFKNSLNVGTGEYDNYYMWPISTIVGIIMAIILVGLCIDVAIRAFKLIILQMIAPIPVMSYIDPKSSKDGAFSHWTKTFITTYIDLFIKLAILYLVLLLIGKLVTGELFGQAGSSWNTATGMSKIYLTVFMVIGLLKFAKEATKFIKDALGIKDNGGGGGFMGKAAAALGGAAAGFAGGVMAGGGLAGGLSGAAGGFGAGAENAGSGKKANIFGQTRDAQAKALGKPEGGLKGKIQQKSLQGRVNRKTGLNADTLEAAKDNWLKKQETADKIKMEYENGVGGHSAEDVVAAQTAASVAQSNYDKANKMADNIGLNQGFMKKQTKHGKPYVAIRNKVIGSSKYDPGSKQIDNRTGIRGGIDEVRETINDKVRSGLGGGKLGDYIADNHSPMSKQQESDVAVKKEGFNPKA